jgi:hypothetical protein
LNSKRRRRKRNEINKNKIQLYINTVKLGNAETWRQPECRKIVEQVGDTEENRTLVITARKGPVSTLTRRSEKNA